MSESKHDSNNANTLPRSNTKSKRNKKRKNKRNGKFDTTKVNGVQELPNSDAMDDEDEGDDSDDGGAARDKEAGGTEDHSDMKEVEGREINGADKEGDTLSKEEENSAQSPADSAMDDTAERLGALAKERDALLHEVTELRKSLENLQVKHEEEVAAARAQANPPEQSTAHVEEISALKAQLKEVQAGKDQAETQYRNLLGKVNTIKAQLGERLKADAEELSQAKSHIEELEEQNRGLKESNESLQKELSRQSDENEEQAKEISSLRSRITFSQQNWAKERDDLIQREAYAREEFEAVKQAMQDWELLAIEERSVREGLGEKVGELEEQTVQLREAYDRAAADRDSQSSTVDALQRALQEIQDARKRELRELVESSQAQADSLKTQLQSTTSSYTETRSALEASQAEISRLKPFEKEIKEKNLLIGKLRHEAVILNDHLTKALRFLKKGKPEDNVDRQIVTNHFLHFLALDRADPKKFQVLQLIAALLGWTDEQREQAGLARPGGSSAYNSSSSSLRFPLSPFYRTPSTPAFTSTDLMPDASGTGSKESLAELWSDFLERETSESGGGGGDGGGSVSGASLASRRPSGAASPKGLRSPPPPPPPAPSGG